MFKKTLLVVILVAASSVAMADGFYAGVGVGGQNLYTHMNDGAGRTYDASKIGFTGGVFGGYALNFTNQFNLGTEAFGDFTTAKASVQSISYTASLKEQYNYGVRLLPGYQVAPDTDIHLLLGYIRGNFKFSDSNVAVGNNTFNLNGFQVGGGMGTNLMKDVAVRGDVVFNGYQNKTVNGFQNKPRSITGIASIAYKFG